MSTMTLEQVRDWHRKQAYACGLFERDQDEGYAHDRMADAIDAHLAQPAQAVDVVAIREVIASLESFPASDKSCRLARQLTRALPASPAPDKEG